MKVWETDGRDVVLKRDTTRYKSPDEMNQIALMNVEIRRVIDEDWPDNIVFWDRGKGLCVSPESDWKCGSFGPGGRSCKRIENHSGRCSDFFSPADSQMLIKILARRRKEELGEILGRPLPSTSSTKYDVRKLRRILQDEERK
ncbi:MAG: hypothetical protein ACW99J_17855 [Candidatus Thorarchaeota archaeon]|jgi:hypothetical protein